MGELYLAMARLIMAFIVIIAIFAAAWLLLNEAAERAMERAEAAVDRRRCSYKDMARKHGRTVREDNRRRVVKGA